ncbi:transporter substrate-binding domain-containing protein [Alteromonas sp. BMJM2]|uniref:transporter substrate-binding domain-containing protein n=1 Tax=Alteromonas sp. BMJM2 TaxID=2954241 RepID=UPI0022B2CA73|nr:transporter substrate-binding domain-containing protein [Alteromonas sp. BMJM2]
MKQWVAAFAFTVFSLVGSSCVFAERFIVGAQNLSYFPHYDFDSDVDKGVGWAILEAFSDATGHEFIYVALPIRRLQMELAKGNIDFVYPDSKRWYNNITNNNDKSFSLPLTQAVTGTIVKKKKAGRGIAAVKNLAMPLGFTPVNWQERVNNGDTLLTSVKDVPQGFALLQQEKVDALDLEYHVAQFSTASLPQYDDVTLDLTLPHNEVSFSISTLRQQTIIDELNRFITSNPKLIESIRIKYSIIPLSELFDSLVNEQQLSPSDIWKKDPALAN